MKIFILGVIVGEILMMFAIMVSPYCRAFLEYYSR
jgi:hypothetical protein